MKPAKKDFWSLPISDYLIGSILVFIALVIPIFIKYAEPASSLEEMYYFLKRDKSGDLFSYYRSNLIYISTMILGFIFAIDFFKRNFFDDSYSDVKKPTLKDIFNQSWIIGYIAFFVIAGVAMYSDNRDKVHKLEEEYVIVGLMISYFFIFLPLAFIACKSAIYNAGIGKNLAVACIIYVAFCILSVTFTDFKYLAFHGAGGRYESFQVLMGYLIMFLAVIRFANSSRKLEIVLYPLLVSCAIISVFGLFQTIGKDLLISNAAAKIILGKHYVEGNKLSAAFSSAYSLLFNPNTLGLYASMMTVFTFFSGMYMPLKKPLKYLLLLLCALMFVSLLSSDSTGGLMGFFVGGFAGVVVTFVYFIKSGKSAAPLFITSAATAIIAIGVIILVPSVSGKIKSSLNKFLNTDYVMSPHFYKDLKVNGAEIEIFYSGGSLKIEYLPEEGNIAVTPSGRDSLVPVSYSKGTQQGVPDKFLYTCPEIGQFEVWFKDNYIAYYHAHVILQFQIDFENQRILALDQRGASFDVNEKIDSIGFKNNEAFASGRGYIWARTLPLILKKPIVGYGPDSFVVSFPRRDYVGKIRFSGNPGLIVDKAHNGYLQTAINSGVISLAALLFVFASYLFKSYKSIISTNDSDRSVFALKFGAFTAVIAFLIAFNTTDSAVSVSPSFWIMLGIGYALLNLSEAGREE